MVLRREASPRPALTQLRGLIDDHRTFQSCGVALGLGLMLRLTFATDAHPRIGVLIKTVYYSVDDLFHLTLLVCMCIGSFLVLAFSQFGTNEAA